jgi:hypothetical protein
MARNKNNIITRGISGAVGKQLVLRTSGERTFLANRPNKILNLVSTPAQKVVQLKFRELVIYASS